MKTLDVYLHRDLVGHLVQDKNGHMAFDYAQSWLNDSASNAISQSLPLREQRFEEHECRGFFNGILPEQHNRQLIAKNLGISAQNDFALLECIGGECAGAITFMPAGQALPQQDDLYRALPEAELASILQQLPVKPLLAGEQDVRLSLAGAQDKLAVKVNDEGIAVPLGNAPSTHILKPAIDRFGDIVFNELLCLKLASAIGIPTAHAEARQLQGKDYLLVRRYDRIYVNKQLTRLHQEDFCQALAIPSIKKYQREGGPSIKDCFNLLREVSSLPVLDLRHLLDGVIFNFLIGNHDAHGKNFSLLYYPDGSTRLAPLYDLICTLQYPQLSQKMAMKIGGHYDSEAIHQRQFEKLAEEAGLAKPEVLHRVSEVAKAISLAIETIDDMPFTRFESLTSLIQQRCESV